MAQHGKPCSQVVPKAIALERRHHTDGDCNRKREEQRCGWLEDRYGVSWQIVPTILPRLLTDKDPEKAQRVMKAMLAMDKIDISVLERA